MRDLRCPRHPKTKFAEVYGTDEGRIEIACRPCRRDLRSIGGADGQVVHVYDMWGRCLRTEVTIDEVPMELPDWFTYPAPVVLGRRPSGA